MDRRGRVAVPGLRWIAACGKAMPALRHLIIHAFYLTLLGGFAEVQGPALEKQGITVFSPVLARSRHALEEAFFSDFSTAADGPFICLGLTRMSH